LSERFAFDLLRFNAKGAVAAALPRLHRGDAATRALLLLSPQLSLMA
jgi:hypothetical protein